MASDFRHRKRREAADAVLRRHISQVGVALDEIDDVEDVVGAGVCRIGADAGVVDIGEFELELAHHRVGMDAGQPLNSCGLALINASMSVITALMSSVISCRLPSLTPPRILSAASLKIAPISARLACGAVAAVAPQRVPGTDAVCAGLAARLERSIGLDGIDGIDDAEMAGAERLFCVSHAAGAPPPFAEALAAEIAVLMSDRIA